MKKIFLNCLFLLESLNLFIWNPVRKEISHIVSLNMLINNVQRLQLQLWIIKSFSEDLWGNITSRNYWIHFLIVFFPLIAELVGLLNTKMVFQLLVRNQPWNVFNHHPLKSMFPSILYKVNLSRRIFFVPILNVLEIFKTYLLRRFNTIKYVLYNQNRFSLLIIYVYFCRK